MKANEAPEKIYVHVKDGKTLNTWNSEWIGVNDIEYIRKDAFIEKACEWLTNFNDCYYIMRYSDCCEVPLDQLIDDFKNYMED